VDPMLGLGAEAARGASMPGMEARGESYRVRLHYEADGHPFEEDIYFTLLFYRNPGGSWTWMPTDEFSLRAARGGLDASTPMLLAVANSSRMNMEWYAINVSMHMLHAQRGVAEQRQLFEHLERFHRERLQLMDQHHDAWEARQASQDRTHHAFTQYVRGVETYQAPDGSRWELPSGYSQVFRDPTTGVTTLTNDPRYEREPGEEPLYRAP